MLRSTYSTLLLLAQPLFAWQFARRVRAYPQYRPRLKEHWGYYSRDLFKHSLWIHAASMGEVAMAKTLIKTLQQGNPTLTFTLSTNTPTGAESANAIVSETVQHVFFPVDRPAVLRRFFRAFAPRALILIEKELWPNALYFCQKNNIPVTLVNGALSPRSFHRLKKLGGLARSLFLNLNQIAAQSEADMKKFLSLGVAKENIHLAGNIKFDMTTTPLAEGKLEAFKSLLGKERLILVAGSTHDGEDSILLACYKRLKAHFPNLLLVLVPRHPERFDVVAKLCDNNRFSCVRRSDNTACTEDTDVFLGDSMGELAIWYQCAHLAFVGGSLVPKGGHNALEPIALNTASLIGKHTFNCQAVIDDLKKAGAIVCVDDEEALYQSIKQLFEHPAKRQIMIDAGHQVLQSNAGAIQKTLAVIATK